MIELNRLYNADYLDGIKDIDDKSIDLIVTDPPYLFDNGNWYKSDILGENSVYTNSELYNNFGMKRFCVILLWDGRQSGLLSS